MSQKVYVVAAPFRQGETVLGAFSNQVEANRFADEACFASRQVTELVIDEKVGWKSEPCWTVVLGLRGEPATMGCSEHSTLRVPGALFKLEMLGHTCFLTSFHSMEHALRLADWIIWEVNAGRPGLEGIAQAAEELR